MIRLYRQSLPTSADSYLRAVTARISAADEGDRATVSERAWRSKSRDRFREVRQTLSAMCSGVERCMYCEDSAWTAVDHFVPRAEDPLLAFAWSNYLAACTTCNSNYKRDAFPRRTDGTRLLIDPTRDEPPEHLVFSPGTGLYDEASESDMGAESIRVFGLNRAMLARGRRDAWHMLQLAIIAYAHSREQGDDEQALRYQAVVARQPFAGVLKALVRVVGSEGMVGVTPQCLAAIDARPEVREWPKAIFAGG